MPKTLYQLDFSRHEFPAAKLLGAGLAKSCFLPLFKRGIDILQHKKHLQKKMHGGQIQLILSDDPTVRVINRDYRGKDVSTDVVSLSYFENELKQMVKKSDIPEMFEGFNAAFGPENLLGEVIISLETAARQAKEHKKTLKQELQFLFVHGLLHIFGYDHEKADERKIMFDLQDEILKTKSWRKIIG